MSEEEKKKHIKSLYAKRGIEADNVDPIEFEVMEEYAASKWVSIKDQTPNFIKQYKTIEISENVLLFGIHGTTTGWLKRFKGTGKIKAEGSGFVDPKSTHWQPLPNPPMK